MRPNFLDCPPRYTRCQDREDNPVDYACAIKGVRRRRFWVVMLWWALMLAGFATLYWGPR